MSRDLRWAEEQPTLTGEKVRLRPWRDTDATAVYEACQAPDVQRYTTVPVPHLRDHEGVMRGRLVRHGVRYDIAVHAALVGEDR
ncbi:GNAT family N-acetyltransferase [Micromonospora sp. NPDC093277]|uniref:GNAT family N-acetyltransferase n=1 Tax=Micromonospora sp. NPDC093277 TaxID=3364291 RepID=UPI00380D2DAB